MPSITLDLPIPPSINRTRRINWAAMPAIKAWTKAADALTMQAWANGRRPKIEIDRFELTIIISKESRCDLDNLLKHSIDLLKRYGLIKDDSPRYMRRVIIEWGAAPYGCKVLIRPTV